MISTATLCRLTIVAALGLTGCNTDGSDGTELTGVSDSQADTDGTIDTPDASASTASTIGDGSAAASSTGTPTDSEASTDDSTSSTDATTTTAASAGSVCVALDVDGLSPQNQSVVEGARRAAAQFGVTATVAESATEADYADTLDTFVADGCSLIVASSVQLANAAEAAAGRHLLQQFAIVDYDYPNRIENMMELTFNTTEPAFLAGYLAAATSLTAVVATYAGINIEPFTLTMDGFITGVGHYNREAGTTVSVLGWDGRSGEFIGTLDDPAAGRAVAETLVAQGADTIFTVAGAAGAGTAALASESSGQRRVIGVDHDQFAVDAAAGSVYLTSVVKHYDVVVVEAVERSIFLGELGGKVVGTLENGGVDLAPFHDQAAAVSNELREQLDELRVEVIAGNVATR